MTAAQFNERRAGAGQEPFLAESFDAFQVPGILRGRELPAPAFTGRYAPDGQHYVQVENRAAGGKRLHCSSHAVKISVSAARKPSNRSTSSWGSGFPCRSLISTCRRARSTSVTSLS